MTTTLEQSRKLHELGVRKARGESLWFIRGEYDIDFYLWYGIGCPLDCNHFTAYSAEELVGMMLCDFEITICDDKTAMIIYYSDKLEMVLTFKGETLTIALGNKLIYDLENEMISVEEVNK